MKGNRSGIDARDVDQGLRLECTGILGEKNNVYFFSLS